MRILQILFLLTLSVTSAYSQKRVLKSYDFGIYSGQELNEYEDYVLLGGEKFNQKNSDGQNEGMWIYYKAETLNRGRFVEIDFDTGKPVNKSNEDSIKMTHYSVTAKGKYKSGLKDGAWTFYNYGNKKADLNFKNGKIEGLVKLYYPNKNTVKYEGIKHPDREDVSFRLYDENGNLIGTKDWNLYELLKYFK